MARTFFALAALAAIVTTAQGKLSANVTKFFFGILLCKNQA